MGRRKTSDFVPADASRRLATRLRELRLQRGWSQEKLAREAGLSTQALRSLETNRTANPGIFTLKALTDALAVGVEDLFAAGKDRD